MSSAPQNDRQAKIAAAGPRRQGTNTKAILAAVVALLVIGGIILAVVLGNRGNDTPAAPSTSGTSGSSTDSASSVKLPKGVADANAPIVATNGGTLRQGVPTLQVFEDFQCPICKHAEDLFGGRIKDLGAQGKINVVYYLKTFMDDNLHNDSSTKTGNAAACAADAGKFEDYHDKIFAKQPTTEGEGYTDEKVQAAATEAGLAGAQLDTWKQCVAGKSYAPYLKGVEDYTAKTMHITGTPAFYVNNKQIALSGIQSADDFEKKLFETAK